MFSSATPDVAVEALDNAQPISEDEVRIQLYHRLGLRADPSPSDVADVSRTTAYASRRHSHTEPTTDRRHPSSRRAGGGGGHSWRKQQRTRESTAGDEEEMPRVRPRAPPPPNSFVADVFCTRSVEGSPTGPAHGTAPPTRFLLARCATLPALLDVLKELTLTLRTLHRGTNSRTATAGGACSGSAGTHAEHTFPCAAEDGRWFTWIDIHGTPSVSHTAGEREGRGIEATRPDSLTGLWAMLGLESALAVELDTVEDRFRPVPSPHRTGGRTAGAGPGGESTEGERTGEALEQVGDESATGVRTQAAAGASDSAPSSRSSSVGREECAEGGPTFRTMAVGDMYLEDLRMRSPDTTRVLCGGPPTHHHGTLTEVAALTEDRVVRPRVNRRRRASEGVVGRDHLGHLSPRKDTRFFANDEEDEEVFFSALPRPRRHCRRCRRGGGRDEEASESGCSRTSCWSSSSASSSSSSTSSTSSDERPRDRRAGLGPVADPPTITSLYLIACPGVCVTWCPASTYGRAAAAAAAVGGMAGETANAASAVPPVPVRSVQGWHRLQRAVLARMRGSGASTAAGIPTTAQFASLLLATVCDAYMPDTAAVLSEVDAIDAMLPLIVPEQESDQADALRRVLVLRRRLAVHRRLLYQKMRLLEELQRPAMRTLAAFMNDPTVVYPERASHAWGAPPRETAVSALSDSPFAGGTFASTRRALEHALRKLDGARTVLGNTTLIYSSSVTSRNCKASTEMDFFQLALTYITLIVIPMSIVACQWGMRCNVPWNRTGKLAPFYGIVGVLLVIAIGGLLAPIYVIKSGKLGLSA